MAWRKGNAPVAAIKQRSYQLHKPEDLTYPNQLWMDACWRPLRGIRPSIASCSTSRQGSTRGQMSTLEKVIEETLHPAFGNIFHQNIDWLGLNVIKGCV
jgi:hypothetical protein